MIQLQGNHFKTLFHLRPSQPSAFSSISRYARPLSPRYTDSTEMSSYLEKQSSAFRGTLASAASKLSNPVSNKPSQDRVSPTPSTASESTTPTAKRKRDALPEVPFSQPQLTGYGADVKTQLTFALDYLKGKRGQTKTLAELIDHLGVRGTTEEHKKELADGLKRHPRVLWKPDPALTEQTWKSGSYAHNPVIPNVKDGTSLLGYLQRKKDASGVSVKDLKDGWPDCEETLADLEGKHKILIFRTKKDNLPRCVWLNDPSLYHTVQPEFQGMWSRVQLPSIEDMHRKLVSVGQKPTSEDPRKITAGGPAKPKQQKKRARKIGKATNVHMQHLMQDYSALRR